MNLITYEFNKKSYTVHGGRTISLLIPTGAIPNIAAVDDSKGYYLLLTNGTGYSYLAKMFSFTASLCTDEILYIPLKAINSEELKSIFPAGYFNGLALMNYSSTQLNVRDLHSLFKIKYYQEMIITKTVALPDQYSENWKTKNRLTVKSYGHLLAISANRDMIHNLSVSSSYLSEYGDDSSLNLFPHYHHDMDDNTSKSLGINFHYWHEE
jgi:hypothetical protein